MSASFANVIFHDFNHRKKKSALIHYQIHKVSSCFLEFDC